MFKAGAEKRFRMALHSWWEEVRNRIEGGGRIENKETQQNG
jgi:hypothetical protein